MTQYPRNSWLLLLGASALLLTGGCEGGSGGLFGLLGGGVGGATIENLFGGGSSGDESFGAFVLSEFSEETGGALGETISDVPGSLSETVATVQNPEPASLALFGGGFVSLALWRRRKGKRS